VAAEYDAIARELRDLANTGAQGSAAIHAVVCHEPSGRRARGRRA